MIRGILRLFIGDVIEGTVLGVNHGTLTLVSMRGEWGEDGLLQPRYVTLHEAGSKYWVGRYTPRGYAGARFITWEVVEVLERTDQGYPIKMRLGEVVSEHPVRWRQAAEGFATLLADHLLGPIHTIGAAK